MSFIRTAFSIAVMGAFLPLGAQQPSTESTAETDTLNRMWDDSTAAGNYDDWYRNCDSYHASITEANYPQLNSYGSVAYGYQTSVVDTPRTVIGNASLGVSGMWGMVRYFGMSSSAANNHYVQYTNNQHYWYPAVYDYRVDTDDRDLANALYPYVSQSVGKSGSETDELRKFFHTLAAFRPEVKDKLFDAGLIMPTLQMIFRWTRVGSDSAYLTGDAHPTAFSDTGNNIAMLQMANAMDTSAVPPMVQLSVEDETFGTTHATRYNEYYKSEQMFTTPAAVARVFRGTEKTKRMVVDASGSYDLNGLPLTYHWAVLRGDTAATRITPLNGDGSRVEIEIDYQHSDTIPRTNRLSSLVIIGAFVHNGTYYSAPGFITSLGLFNETRTYGSDGLIDEIAYDATTIESGVSKARSWDGDTYEHDFNGRMLGWWRQTGSAQERYTAEGYRADSLDRFGRSAVAHEMYYATSDPVTPESTYTAADWRYRMTYEYSAASTDSGTAATVDLGASAGTVTEVTAPEHGTVSTTNSGFEYTPDSAFTGVDMVCVMERNSSGQFTRIHKVRVAVGPADNEAPDSVTGVTTYSYTYNSATVAWDHTTDNLGVAGYVVYRDGAVVGTSYAYCELTDTGLAAGDSAVYTVTAFDDAGNESPASAGYTGGNGDLWGQDDFADGDYTTADPGLLNGMAWTNVAGNASMLSGGLAVGRVDSRYAYTVSEDTLAPPFSFEFYNYQAYVSVDQGPMVLYQDTSNFYFCVINRSRFALYRVMDDDTTLLGSNTDLQMQHSASSATFEIRVTSSGSALSFACERRDWSVSPDGVAAVTYTDTDPAVLALFASGHVGFTRRSATSTYNTGYYDDIYVTRHTGVPPGDVPVELASFTAVRGGTGVDLAWQTRTETGCLGFNVQRGNAEDGPFVQVNAALIPGAGTVALPRQYAYADGDAPAGELYYRLEQVDTDGARQYYGPVRVPAGTSGIGVPGAVPAAGGHAGEAFDIRGTRVLPGGNGIRIIREGTTVRKVLELE